MRIDIKNMPNSKEVAISYAPPPTIVTESKLLLREAVSAYLLSPSFQSFSPQTKVIRTRFFNRTLYGRRDDPKDQGSGHLPLSSITKKSIVQSRDRRAATPRAATEFVKSMKHFFSWAVESDLVTTNPCEGVKGVKMVTTHYQAWPIDFCERFRKHWALGTMPRLAFEVHFNLGIRSSDGAALPSTAIDMAKKQVRLKQQKTGKWLIVPILEDLQTAIKATRNALGNPPLTIIHKGDMQPFSPKSYSARFSAWAQEAGVPKGYTIHGLRHTLGAHLAEAGASKHEIAAMLGHDGTRSVGIYTTSVDTTKLAASASARLRTYRTTLNADLAGKVRHIA